MDALRWTPGKPLLPTPLLLRVKEPRDAPVAYVRLRLSDFIVGLTGGVESGVPLFRRCSLLATSWSVYLTGGVVGVSPTTDVE